MTVYSNESDRRVWLVMVSLQATHADFILSQTANPSFLMQFNGGLSTSETLQAFISKLRPEKRCWAGILMFAKQREHATNIEANQ